MLIQWFGIDFITHFESVIICNFQLRHYTMEVTVTSNVNKSTSSNVMSKMNPQIQKYQTRYNDLISKKDASDADTIIGLTQLFQDVLAECNYALNTVRSLQEWDRDITDSLKGCFVKNVCVWRCFRSFVCWCTNCFSVKHEKHCCS